MILFWLALLGFSSCILNPGEERRPEILPGRYQSENGTVRLIYDFHSNGTFTFQRYESTRLTISEEGKWRYRYLDSDRRYLDEFEVTRKNFSTNDTWNTQDSVNYSYAIEASSDEELVLNPGSGDGQGFFLLLTLFSDTYVHFQRL